MNLTCLCHLELLQNKEKCYARVKLVKAFSIFSTDRPKAVPLLQLFFSSVDGVLCGVCFIIVGTASLLPSVPWKSCAS